MEFPLETPLKTASGEEIKALTLQEPRQRDLELSDEELSGHAKVRRLLAGLSERDPDDLRELSLIDYRNLGELVNAFL